MPWSGGVAELESFRAGAENQRHCAGSEKRAGSVKKAVFHDIKSSFIRKVRSRVQ
jgi:hypothetical protein